jgi:hypothetical protein
MSSTRELEAGVVAVVPDQQRATARGPGGLEWAITGDSKGERWRDLAVGQRVRLTVFLEHPHPERRVNRVDALGPIANL